MSRNAFITKATAVFMTFLLSFSMMPWGLSRAYAEDATSLSPESMGTPESGYVRQNSELADTTKWPSPTVSVAGATHDAHKIAYGENVTYTVEQQNINWTSRPATTAANMIGAALEALAAEGGEANPVAPADADATPMDVENITDNTIQYKGLPYSEDPSTPGTGYANVSPEPSNAPTYHLVRVVDRQSGNPLNVTNPNDPYNATIVYTADPDPSHGWMAEYEIPAWTTVNVSVDPNSNPPASGSVARPYIYEINKLTSTTGPSATNPQGKTNAEADLPFIVPGNTLTMAYDQVAAGYHFKQWNRSANRLHGGTASSVLYSTTAGDLSINVGDVTGYGSYTDADYSKIKYDVTYTAVFEQDFQGVVSVYVGDQPAAGAGEATITNLGSDELKNQGVFRLKAVESNEQYRFDHWERVTTGSPESIGTDLETVNTCTALPGANVEYRAVFAANSTVTVGFDSNTTGDDGTVAAVYHKKPGESVTMKAKPNTDEIADTNPVQSHLYFAGWFKNAETTPLAGSKNSRSYTYTVPDPIEDEVSFTAKSVLRTTTLATSEHGESPITNFQFADAETPRIDGKTATIQFVQGGDLANRYEFVGWKKDGNDGYFSYDNPATVTIDGDHTYTACFQPIEHAVAFEVEPDTAPVKEGYPSPVEWHGAQQVGGITVESTVIPTPDSTRVTRPYFTLVGWTATPGGTAMDCAAGADYTIKPADKAAIAAGTFKLYAVWADKPTRTITLNSRGGTAHEPLSDIEDYSVTLPNADEVTCQGYTLVKWVTGNATNPGVSYDPGASIKLSASSPTALNAVWEQNSASEMSISLAMDNTYFPNWATTGKPAVTLSVKNGATLVPGTDYTVAYDTGNNRITCTFTDSYLQSKMTYSGETYVMSVSGVATTTNTNTLKNAPRSGNSARFPDQQAKTTFNGQEPKFSTAVHVEEPLPTLSLVKSVTGGATTVSGHKMTDVFSTVSYRITVSNSNNPTGSAVVVPGVTVTDSITGDVTVNTGVMMNNFKAFVGGTQLVAGDDYTLEMNPGSTGWTFYCEEGMGVGEDLVITYDTIMGNAAASALKANLIGQDVVNLANVQSATMSNSSIVNMSATVGIFAPTIRTNSASASPDTITSNGTSTLTSEFTFADAAPGAKIYGSSLSVYIDENSRAANFEGAIKVYKNGTEISSTNTAPGTYQYNINLPDSANIVQGDTIRLVYTVKAPSGTELNGVGINTTAIYNGTNLKHTGTFTGISRGHVTVKVPELSVSTTMSEYFPSASDSVTVTHRIKQTQQDATAFNLVVILSDITKKDEQIISSEGLVTKFENLEAKINGTAVTPIPANAGPGVPSFRFDETLDYNDELVITYTDTIAATSAVNGIVDAANFTVASTNTDPAEKTSTTANFTVQTPDIEMTKRVTSPVDEEGQPMVVNVGDVVTYEVTITQKNPNARAVDFTYEDIVGLTDSEGNVIPMADWPEGLPYYLKDVKIVEDETDVTENYVIYYQKAEAVEPVLFNEEGNASDNTVVGTESADAAPVVMTPADDPTSPADPGEQGAPATDPETPSSVEPAADDPNNVDKPTKLHIEGNTPGLHPEDLTGSRTLVITYSMMAGDSSSREIKGLSLSPESTFAAVNIEQAASVLPVAFTTVADAELSITKESDVDQVENGERAVYTLTVKNVSASARSIVKNVLIGDILDPMTFELGYRNDAKSLKVFFNDEDITDGCEVEWGESSEFVIETHKDMTPDDVITVTYEATTENIDEQAFSDTLYNNATARSDNAVLVVASEDIAYKGRQYKPEPEPEPGNVNDDPVPDPEIPPSEPIKVSVDKTPVQKTGDVILYVVGGVAVLAIIGGIVAFIIRRRNR